MSKFLNLRRDDRGAAIVEFALSVPMLILMIWGIFQLGLIFQANAGMQHALGEGARFATVYVEDTSNHQPTDEQIEDTIADKVFGVGPGNFSDPSVTTPPTSDCTNCRLLSVTYTMTPNFLFFNGPPINVTRTKRVYLAT